jgi:hypothetical protein
MAYAFVHLFSRFLYSHISLVLGEYHNPLTFRCLYAPGISRF